MAADGQPKNDIGVEQNSKRNINSMKRNHPTQVHDGVDSCDAASATDDLGRRLASLLPKELELSPEVLFKLEAARLRALERSKPNESAQLVQALDVSQPSA